MQRGPKPAPTNLRVLKGDHHKSRYNLDEPRFEAADYSPPSRVTSRPNAKEMWEFLAPRLSEVGLLTEGDLHALETLCLAWDRYTADPNASNGKFLQSMLCEFGLTPSSRSRITGLKPQKAKSEMERLLAGG